MWICRDLPDFDLAHEYYCQERFLCHIASVCTVLYPLLEFLPLALHIKFWEGELLKAIASRYCDPLLPSASIIISYSLSSLSWPSCLYLKTFVWIIDSKFDRWMTHSDIHVSIQTFGPSWTQNLKSGVDSQQRIFQMILIMYIYGNVKK